MHRFAQSARLQSNFAQRIAVGLLAGPAVMFAALHGGSACAILAAFASAACAREWVRMACPDNPRLAWAATAAALPALWSWNLSGYPVQATSASACFLALAVACPFSRSSRLAALGVAYAGVFGASLVALSGPGIAALAWLLAAVWSADIGAYAVGRLAGGPKLAPTVSPGKTWSGFAGAVLCAAAVGAAWPLPGTWLAGSAFLGASLGALGQCGDLMESAVKRRAGSKDSGSLLPGHGGMLDRTDALMACAPALAALLICPGR